jgi:hypothetical protein
VDPLRKAKLAAKRRSSCRATSSNSPFAKKQSEDAATAALEALAPVEAHRTTTASTNMDNVAKPATGRFFLLLQMHVRALPFALKTEQVMQKIVLIVFVIASFFMTFQSTIQPSDRDCMIWELLLQLHCSWKPVTVSHLELDHAI